MPDISHQLRVLRSKGGFARLDDFAVIEVRGREAAKLLQARTTHDVASLKPGHGQLNCLLDRTAHLQAVFSLYRFDDCFWIVTEKQQVRTIVEQIELYHFREDVTLADRSSDGYFWTVQGPEAAVFVRRHLNVPDPENVLDLDAFAADFNGNSVTILRRSLTGEDGYLVWVPQDANEAVSPELRRDFEKLSLVELSAETLEVARIEAGLPKFGLDISAHDLVTDTGLEQVAVSYDKGCYVGQEVVARIKTYSAPRKGLVGLIFPEGSPASFPVGTPCQANDGGQKPGPNVGELKSNAFSPTIGHTIALAFLKREYREPGQNRSLDIDGAVYEVTVVLLPFFTPLTREQRARQLYEQALADFAADKETESIELLRTALVLDPGCADVYEALGVILSKVDQLDEAIELMEKLVLLDADSVMAHTNLSVFYMQKGDKERAEEEKALAMGIQMRKIAQEAAQEQKVKEDKKRQREEAAERLRMFHEVLEIDADDLLANYGLGNVHVDLGEYALAIPYLKKAIEVKPTHTVAYLALGQALEALERIPEALETYKEGVNVAAKRGDMIPLKEMQNRLAQLQVRA